MASMAPLFPSFKDVRPTVLGGGVFAVIVAVVGLVISGHFAHLMHLSRPHPSAWFHQTVPDVPRTTWGGVAAVGFVGVSIASLVALCLYQLRADAKQPPLS